MTEAEEQVILTAVQFIMRAMAFRGRFMTKDDFVEVFTREELVEFKDALDAADRMVSGSDELDAYLRGVLAQSRRMLKEILEDGSG
jgi:hypothetical protein